MEQITAKESKQKFCDKLYFHLTSSHEQRFALIDELWNLASIRSVSEEIDERIGGGELTDEKMKIISAYQRGFNEGRKLVTASIQVKDENIIADDIYEWARLADEARSEKGDYLDGYVEGAVKILSETTQVKDGFGGYCENRILQLNNDIDELRKIIPKGEIDAGNKSIKIYKLREEIAFYNKALSEYRKFVPVSEVGQVEKPEHFLTVYLSGFNWPYWSKENAVKAILAYHNQFLPVPNTKTVEGEDIKKLLNNLQQQINYVCYEDGMTIKLQKVWSAFFDIQHALSSLRSNETEQKGRNVKYEFYFHDGSLMYSCKTEEKKNKYENELKSKNVKYTLEVLDNETEREGVDNKVKHFFDKVKVKDELVSLIGSHGLGAGDVRMLEADDIERLAMSITNAFFASPPLKELSEISVSDEIELGNILCSHQPGFFIMDLAGKNRYNVQASRALEAFQYLQHRGYAVPVFYPVPEVKEKGEIKK